MIDSDFTADGWDSMLAQLKRDANETQLLMIVDLSMSQSPTAQQRSALVEAAKDLSNLKANAILTNSRVVQGIVTAQN